MLWYDVADVACFICINVNECLHESHLKVRTNFATNCQPIQNKIAL